MADVPIVCDMSTAPDTEEERIEEYRRLFTQALAGRERTPEGIRFRFRAAGPAEELEELEAWVRDLAAREKACCGFYSFEVRRDGAEVIWDASVVDDDVARAVLDEFYALPEMISLGADELMEHYTRLGLRLTGAAAGPAERAGSAAAEDHAG